MYTLVIADDERRICESMEAVIRAHFPDIEIVGSFSDGSALYSFISEYHVDILITDIRMPNKTGLDIAKLIHDNGHRTYCILITAYRDFDYARQAIQLGVDDFLLKPYLSSELLSIVQKAVQALHSRKCSSNHAQVLLRRLVQSFYKNPVLQEEPGLYRDQRISFFENRYCTEITISTNDPGLLSGKQRAQWQNAVISAAECENSETAIIYAGTENNDIVFLAFTKGPPDSTLSAFQYAIVEKLCNTVTFQLSSFSNLDAYLTDLVWSRKLSAFFSTVTGVSLTRALTDIEQTLKPCTLAQRQDFAQFLDSHYHICPTGFSVEELLDCMEGLVKQSLQNQSSSIHLVDACSSYILQHLNDSSLSLDSVACAHYVTPPYLSRIFRKKTGQTFSEYLQQARMERAREILSTTNLPTKEIAAMVGYPNVPYFRNLFKSLFGLTPLQFRQLREHQEDT